MVEEDIFASREKFLEAISPLLQIAETNERSGLMRRATSIFHDLVSRLSSARAASQRAGDERDRDNATKRMRVIESQLDELRSKHQDEWRAWSLQLRVTAMVHEALDNKIIQSLSELKPLSTSSTSTFQVE